MNLELTFKNYLYRLNYGIGKQFADKEQLEIKVSKNKPIIINIVLFIVTFITTSLAGASSGNTLIEILVSGLPYSITLILILLTHEFGHYFAARYYGVRATLPYFIPFPSIVGTMGAVIKVKSTIPHRRALFYIGSMGPLAGFIISLAAVIYGISMSEIKSLPPGGGEMPVPIFGNSILFYLIVRIYHGIIPPGNDIFLTPYAWAGWIGFLVTSLNLMPVGQLDGSHILYAMIGNKQRYFGWIVLSGLIVMSIFWYGWIVWIILVMLLLMVGHPPVKKIDDLRIYEKVLGWICIIIFLLTFIPIPVEFI